MEKTSCLMKPVCCLCSVGTYFFQLRFFFNNNFCMSRPLPSLLAATSATSTPTSLPLGGDSSGSSPLCWGHTSVGRSNSRRWGSCQCYLLYGKHENSRTNFFWKKLFLQVGFTSYMSQAIMIVVLQVIMKPLFYKKTNPTRRYELAVSWKIIETVTEPHFLGFRFDQKSGRCFNNTFLGPETKNFLLFL